MNISMTKEALLKRLKEQLAEAKAEDKRQAEKHQKDEAAALEKWRAKLRAALKSTYHEAKKVDGYMLRLDPPPCPKLSAPRFERLIASLKLDCRESSFSLHENGDLHEAVTWLPESKRPKETVCD